MISQGKQRMKTHHKATSAQIPLWAGATSTTRKEVVDRAVTGSDKAIGDRLMSGQRPAGSPCVQGTENKPDTELLWMLTKFLSLATQ